MIDSVTNLQNLVNHQDMREGVYASLTPRQTKTESGNNTGDRTSSEVDTENYFSENSFSASDISDTKKAEQMVEEQTEEKIKELVSELNTKLFSLDKEAHFRVDKEINKNYISVINKDTKEVIKEFPPKEIRAFIAKVNELSEKAAGTQTRSDLFINIEV